MYVVLDTSSINLDFKLANSETRFLLEHAPRRNLTVCVPEVVVQEMASHFRAELEKAKQQVAKGRGDLSRLLSRELPEIMADQEIEIAVTRFEHDFRDRLQSFDVHIVSMPPTSSLIDTLLRRDFEQRKPFGKNGGGMRDALIWESVLELCRRSPKHVALISANVRDFANASKEQLHEDLLEDLEQIGQISEFSRIYKSVKEFNDANIRLEAASSTDLPTVQSQSQQDEITQIIMETRTDIENLDPHGDTHESDLTLMLPQHSPDDDLILTGNVSEQREADFLRRFLAERKNTRVTEALFERAGKFSVIQSSPDLGKVRASGFKHLVFKGPFVEGSNWLSYPVSGYAVALETHLLARFEETLRNATLNDNPDFIERNVPTIVYALDAMRSELDVLGYSASLFVITGKLGYRLRSQIIDAITPYSDPKVGQLLKSKHRILGLYKEVPLLDIAEAPMPALYAVDLSRFGSLKRYGAEPEFSITEFDETSARELLASQPRLISTPPPDVGLDDERVRQLRLKVGLDLWETYELMVEDEAAVRGRNLT